MENASNANDKDMNTHLDKVLSEKNITRGELAARLGIALSDLKKRFDGRYRFDTDEIDKIMKILSISFSELFSAEYRFKISNKDLNRKYQNKYRLSPNRHYSFGKKQLDEITRLADAERRSVSSIIQEAVNSLTKNQDEHIDDIDDINVEYTTTLSERTIEEIERLATEKDKHLSEIVRIALHEFMCAKFDKKISSIELLISCPAEFGQLKRIYSLAKKRKQSAVSIIYDALSSFIENYDNVEFADLEVLPKLGRKPTRQDFDRRIIAMPEDLKTELESLSSEKGQSASKLIHAALYEYLRNEEK